MTGVDPDVLSAWGRGIGAPVRLTVSEFSDRDIVLAGVSASEPGPWRTSRTPHLREPLDRLSPSDPCKVVVLMFGAQNGKTQLIVNWGGFTAAESPAPMMIALPTEMMADAFVAQRLTPMIEASPAVRAAVNPSRAKDSGSTKNIKLFAGGMIRMAWFNSPVTLRSMPAERICLDEIDAQVDEPEGDFVDLAYARTSTFPRHKMLLTSTPDVLSTSRIWKWYLRGDQRVRMVPCPHCGERFVLDQQGLKWERGDDGMPVPRSAHYICESCGCEIREHHKTEMLARAEWVPTARGEEGIHSYWLPSHYAPAGWLSWDSIATSFALAYRDLKENHDPRRMKAFVNTREGRPWDDAEETEQNAWAAVMRRAEPYTPRVVPESVLFLVAGVDTQNDRLEVKVEGYGLGEEAWLVEYEVIYGDPDEDEVWERLDEILDTAWPTADGREMRILSTAIDSGGHRTQAVYRYARTRRNRGVVAIKGANQMDAPILSKPTLQDVDHRGARLKGGVQLWNVGVGRIKRILARRLKITSHGPGRMHTYEGLTEDWYQQLCSEKLVVKHSGGKQTERWVRVEPSQAAEVWDCSVYAYFAAIRVGMDRGLLEKFASQRGRLPARSGIAPRAHAPDAPVERPEPVEGPAVRTVVPSQGSKPRRRANRSTWLGS